jgi:flagellar biosynthesis/type III secretory pathway protein FliH
MTPLRAARILKREAVARAGATVLSQAPVAPNLRRRLSREALDAHLLAQRLVDDARKEAEAIRADARESAEHFAASAAEEARQVEHAKLAALYVALRVEDERRQERDLDRTIGLARVLAERLLGEALEGDPTRIVALARQALAEASGATCTVIEACPLDADVLRSHLPDVGLASSALAVKIDPHLERGSLRVHTNLGTLDVQLAPQLERLAKALRDALA